MDDIDDAPSAQKMTRSSTKVVPAEPPAPIQFLFTVQIDEPLGMTIGESAHDSYHAMVTEVVDGGQAAGAGIRVGMLIIMINYSSLEGKATSDVVQMIKYAKTNLTSLVMEVYLEPEPPPPPSTGTTSLFPLDVKWRGVKEPEFDSDSATLFDTYRRGEYDPNDANYLPAKHSDYPNKDAATMIEKWGGSLFECNLKDCLKYTFFPCLAYARIGGFNMANIQSTGARVYYQEEPCANDGVQPPNDDQEEPFAKDGVQRTKGKRACFCSCFANEDQEEPFQPPNRKRVEEHFAKDGVQPPNGKRACFNQVGIGCAYYNVFCCWAQGNRRKTLEVKLHTAADKSHFKMSCCVNGFCCPCADACLHLWCHPCALSQEVRAVAEYERVVGVADNKQDITGGDCLCGIFRANFPCAGPCFCLLIYMGLGK